MKITNEWLNKEDACTAGRKWFKAQSETDGVTIVKKLITENKLDWANWLIVRIMKRKQYLAYAIYAAEQVIEIFEQKYPNDKRPRKALDAAKSCLANSTKENRTAAGATAYAAHVAANAANAANAATYAAADAAYAAYAAYAANAAAHATAYAAEKEMKTKILNYGLELMERKHKCTT